MNNINTYETPDFDVTIYEVEDILTTSGNPTDEDVTFGPSDPNEGGDWFG